MKNWTSLSLKGCWAVSVLPLQYLPGQRIKKKANQVRLLMVIFLGVVSWAVVSKDWITLTGRVGTLVGG